MQFIKRRVTPFFSSTTLLTQSSVKTYDSEKPDDDKRENDSENSDDDDEDKRDNETKETKKIPWGLKIENWKKLKIDKRDKDIENPIGD